MGSIPAELMARDACRWVKTHRKDFKRLMAVMHRQVDDGNPCAKQGEVEFYAREMGIEFDVAGAFRHNRNLYPAIARYMVMLRPRLAKTINFRRSKLDEIDLAEIWHEEVDPRTVFLAQSRKEAEWLVEVGDVSAA